MTSNWLTSAKQFGKDRAASLLARAIPQSIAFDKRYFPLWERRGFHITTNHFYEPVPASATLDEHDFSTAGDLRGIDFRDAEQLALLHHFQQQYRGEYGLFPATGKPTEPTFYLQNDTFAEVDAEVLYCMIRHRKPQRIIEIGCGFSTRIIGQALARNAADGSPASHFSVIDPFAQRALLRAIPCVTEVMERPVQQVEPSYFDHLESADVLFIDSSHVLKTGSDVQFEFLTILPRLKPGVIVHVHDVFLPADYPSEWLRSNRWFWSEQYLLQAFLQFNERFQIVWAGNYMHLRHPAELASAFESYRSAQRTQGRNWPASFWLERVS